MKFAHLSDCHIGAWHEHNLRDISLKSFKKAVEICIEEHVGFILIAGDLFDTAMPSIDILKETTKILNKLKDHDIPIYLIPGSHDFSASGKTMLDVLENAGLIHNVMKFDEGKLQFTIDRTGTKITGFYGKKGGLEASEYESLEKSHLESEKGLKIFLFHSLIDELKPKKFELVKGMSINSLPKNFDYYAGGHPHFIHNQHHNNYGILAYPGPIFPNNFQELEDLKQGGFYIAEVNNKINLKHVKLNIIPTISYKINAENKTPKEVETEILNTIKDFDNKIITLRLEGCLKEGRTTDINFKYIAERLESSFCFLKNTNKLTTKDFAEIQKDCRDSAEIEESIIKEHIKQSEFNEDFIKNLINILDKEKGEGEKNSDFELRILKDCKSLINI